MQYLQLQTTLLNRPTVMDAMITLSRQIQVCVGPNNLVDIVQPKTAKLQSLEHSSNRVASTDDDFEVIEMPAKKKKSTKSKPAVELCEVCHKPKP